MRSLNLFSALTIMLTPLLCPLVALAQEEIGIPETYQFETAAELSSSNPILGMSFSTPAGGFIVQKAFFNVSALTDGPVRVQVGFQLGDVGNRNELAPNTKWLDGTFAEVTVGGPGLVEASFPKPVNLPAYTPVFLVVTTSPEGSQGTLAISVRLSPRKITPVGADETAQSQTDPMTVTGMRDSFSGFYDPMMAETPAKVFWRRESPIFLLVNPQGEAFGNPMNSSRAASIRSANQVIQQKIRIPEGTAPLSARTLSLIARFMSEGEPKTLALQVSISDATSGAELSTGQLNFDAPTPTTHVGGETYHITLQPELKLKPGQEYYIIIKPEEPHYPGQSVMFFARSVGDIWRDKVPSIKEWKDVGYGLGAEISGDGGSSFSPPKGEWINIPFLFQ